MTHEEMRLSLVISDDQGNRSYTMPCGCEGSSGAGPYGATGSDWVHYPVCGGHADMGPVRVRYESGDRGFCLTIDEAEA